ncbi:LmeA family phospholipid-binding protein [Prosthecobacter dejongeii]|uniref:Uncharacterized protein YpmS n=1 Tax=Prosthecobacter dejongeii TaxID=48465 RepID=A0A7W7YJZ5_9BACT|nr:LmeA family phospholipid-binding protein [Prosthecobacter dejongeii]MBB5037524.1 uncharacterized protein YpmS [Prosthecobacter dejongeii]
METPPNIPAATDSRPLPRVGSSWQRKLLIVGGILLLGCGLTAAATAWWVKRNIYADLIQPVSLTNQEQQMLEAKLHVLETSAAPASQPETSPGENERTLVITAKEINAYLASQNLGETVQVQLGTDSISATVLAPVPADAGLPLISGTTVRLGVNLSARMDDQKKVALQVNDVRLGGLPMPNAWLGYIKGVNLAGENLEKDPGLQRFLAGIQSLKITSEGLRIVLAE